MQIDVRSRVKPLVISVVVAVAIYVAVMTLVGYEQILQSAKRLSVWNWMLILCLSIANYLIRFLRWHWYMQLLGHPIPFVRHLRIYLAGFAFTTTPGKSGEMVRSIYLKSEGVGYTSSLATFFAERFCDLLTLIPLALLASVYIEGYEWLVVVAIVVITLGLLIVHHARTRELILYLCMNRKSNRVKRIAEHFVNVLDSAARLLGARALILGCLSGVLAWSAEGVALYVILHNFGITVPLVVSIGIFSLAVLVGAVSIIPGGLGSSEAVMVVLLMLIGLGASQAVAATLISSISALWFAVLIGVLAILSIQLSGTVAPSTSDA